MYEVFNKELSYIKDEKIRNSLKTMLNLLPEYFYQIPASSTGKYHPEFTLGDGGLVRHTKAVVRIAYELLQNPSLNNFTEEEKDLLLFALTVHDGLKNGRVKGRYTAIDHPIQMSNYVKESKDKLELTDSQIDLICRCIATHMGPWTTDFDGNEVLEPPKDKYQRFVHMCDFLASKKFLEVPFEKNEIIG